MTLKPCGSARSATDISSSRQCGDDVEERGLVCGAQPNRGSILRGPAELRGRVAKSPHSGHRRLVSNREAIDSLDADVLQPIVADSRIRTRVLAEPRRFGRAEASARDGWRDPGRHDASRARRPWRMCDAAASLCAGAAPGLLRSRRSCHSPGASRATPGRTFPLCTHVAACIGRLRVSNTRNSPKGVGQRD